MQGSVSGKTKKQKKNEDEDDDSYGETDLQILPSPKARYADRKPGSFSMCAECNKKV